MSPGDYGTRAVPTYIAAEAETTPLPKITVPETRRTPASGGKGLGDLPMRVVYKAGVGMAAVAVVGLVASFVFISRDAPAAGPARGPVAGAAPVASSLPSAPGTPLTAASAAAPSSVPSPVPSSVPSPSPSPGRTVMEAALSDPRVPVLPAVEDKLEKLTGTAASTKGLIKDRRSGVSLPRFAKEWSLATSSPFASRQVLPRVKGTAYRGLLVSCPVPIPVQERLVDTAFLAARWTLNHHPSGATISWTASQPVTVSKRDGWLLAYEVNYTLNGKKRTSMAAITLVDVPENKPGLVFITIPDTQKRRWRDINEVMSHLKVL